MSCQYKELPGMNSFYTSLADSSAPVVDPKSYRPNSLLCVPYKILKRMIYNRVEPIVDPLFPKNRLDFDTESLPWIRLFCLRKTLRIFLRQKMKAGAVFVNLTAAYDTVWHRGLTCKLLRVLPDKHMV